MAEQKLIRMTRSGTRIDILMAIKGIKTDKELAKQLGLKTPQALYSKLSGNISMNTIELLADFFDVPVKEMFR